jgi:protocatechuate 3,4-dioxygenase beta subunit
LFTNKGEMMNSNDSTVNKLINRRTFLNAGALGAGSVVLANAFEPCTEFTRQNELGPFFRTGAPWKTNLIEPDMKHSRHIMLYGRVLDEQCRPVRGAVLKIWQADGGGKYDCTGYRLRGNIHADEEGQYHVRTIFPAAYNDPRWGKRCPHIHFMVGLPNKPKLVTQLFFRGTNPRYSVEHLRAMNHEDNLYQKNLAVHLVPSNRIDGVEAEFDFVINTRVNNKSIPEETGCVEMRQGR